MYHITPSKIEELNLANSIVVVGDIRNSEKLIKLIGIDYYTELISVFLNNTLNYTNDYDCVLERFTGDGFVIIFPSKNNLKYDVECSKFVESIMHLYRVSLENTFKLFLDQGLIKNKSYEEYGLGIGVNYGKVEFNLYGNFLYSVGLPILKATRLSEDASPWTINTDFESLFKTSKNIKKINSKSINYKTYKYG